MHAISLSLAAAVLLSPAQATTTEKGGEKPAVAKKSAPLKATTPRQRKIVLLRREIKALAVRADHMLRRPNANRPGWVRINGERAAKIRGLSELEKAEGPPWYVSDGKLPARKLKVGDDGTLQDETVEIQQVIDDLNMLVTIYWDEQAWTWPILAVPYIEQESDSVWIRGLSTAAFADEQRAELGHAFRVTSNVGGASRTVLVLEVVQEPGVGPPPAFQPE